MMLLEGLKWSRKYKETKELPKITDDLSGDEKSLFKLLAEEIPKNPDLFENL